MQIYFISTTILLTFLAELHAAEPKNSTVHFFVLLVPTSALGKLQRIPRQEEAAEGAATAAAEGTAAFVGQILSGVFGGDIRSVFAGSTAFIPEGDFRDGVTDILQQGIAPHLVRFFSTIRRTVDKNFNTTTQNPFNIANRFQQQQQQNQYQQNYNQQNQFQQQNFNPNNNQFQQQNLNPNNQFQQQNFNPTNQFQQQNTSQFQQQGQFTPSFNQQNQFQQPTLNNQNQFQQPTFNQNQQFQPNNNFISNQQISKVKPSFNQNRPTSSFGHQFVQQSLPVSSILNQPQDEVLLNAERQALPVAPTQVSKDKDDEKDDNLNELDRQNLPPLVSQESPKDSNLNDLERHNLPPLLTEESSKDGDLSDIKIIDS